MNLEKLFEVYEFAKKSHGDQKRKTGEPYITHPVAVANIVRKYSDGDDEVICACLLHDIVEDTSVSLEEIEKRFGKDISYLVDGVTKIKGDKIATFLKVRDYAIVDKRVALIKLADRIHNISTPIDDLEWKRNYSESTKFYIRLGHEIGHNDMAFELEKLNKGLKKRSEYDKQE